MGMSFITGFVTDDGTIEMSQTQITRRYLRTWFGLDLLVVGIDWAEVFVRSLIGVSYGRLAKVTRTFRIIRMVRLLRLARMKEVLGLITERFSSHKIIILSDIGKLLFFIVGLGHLIACLWFGIGNIADGDKGWVGHYEFNNRPIGDQYAMSMNWAMSQFVGGMDEITPENAGERVFAMVCLIIAFVIAALFISSITSSMTELQMLGSSETKKVSMLRIFLAQHKISSKLTMRVTRNAQHSMKEKNKSLPEDQIECLKLFVSEPLRMELHFEIFAPIFRMHPFFGRYIEEYPQVMRRVCHSAVAMEDVSGGDIIFHVGEIPQQPKMYFLCSGTLRYTATDNTKVDLQAGDWISEAVLWTLWMYRGELCATSNCRLCVLDAKQFQDMAGQFHHHGDFSPKQYAEQFVSRLSENAKTTNDFTDLTDFSDCSKTLKRSKTLVGSLAESR
jgi:hyperpolarization activated cyclic nucleotide-gated potassium channel 2